MDTPKLFLSYASEDELFAKQLGEILRKQKGIDAFLAVWEILPGDSFVQKMNAGLAGAKTFVVLLSDSSIGKVWPEAEWDVATIKAVEDNTRLIPVNLGIAANRIPPLIRRLKWVTGDSATVANQIAETVFGENQKPPVGTAPRYAVEKSPDFPSHPSLRPADRTVLRILFELGQEHFFSPDLDQVRAASAEQDIDAEMLDGTLEFLEERSLVKLQKASGGILGASLTTTAAEACCEALISDYADRKRRILAEIVNSDSGGSDALVKTTGEASWLICHVLREADLRGLIGVHPIYVGYDCLLVHRVSPGLKRMLEDAK